jgi:hypothetical protein
MPIVVMINMIVDDQLALLDPHQVAVDHQQVTIVVAPNDAIVRMHPKRKKKMM